jgi:hypothetical protein
LSGALIPGSAALRRIPPISTLPLPVSIGTVADLDGDNSMIWH